MIRCVLLSFTVAIAALVSAGALAKASFQHALIIGVSRYADSSVPPLDGVPHDMTSAREIARAMGIPTNQVTELRDGKATKAAITDALNRLARDTTEGGRVLVYFSGHGTRWFDPQAGGCVEGLLTYDSQVIVNREFAALVGPIGAKADKLIIMFDACHSGGVNAFRSGTRSVAPGLSPKFFVKATQAPDSCGRPANMRTRSLLGAPAGSPAALAENVVQITSSRPDEVSFDDARSGGLATQGVRDCLLGKAQDLDGSGAITLAEIEACARDFVREKVRPFPDLLPHHVNVSGLRNLIAQPVSSRPGSGAGPVAASTALQDDAVRREKERLQKEQQARAEQARLEAIQLAELRAEQIRQEQARLLAEREAAERQRQQEQARLAALAEQQRQREEEVRRRQEAERLALEAQAREREEAARRRAEAERLALAAQAREREEAARWREQQEQQERQAAAEAARVREEQARMQRELEERQRQERERARLESERLERERIAAAERDRQAREQEVVEQQRLAELARVEQRAAEEELERQQRERDQRARENEQRDRLALMSPSQGAPVAESPTQVVAAVAALRDIHEQRDRRRVVQVVPSRTRLKIGHDPLQLTVTSSHDGYLYIVLLGSDEKSFYLLYPNGLDKDNRVRARVPLTLPRPSWEVVAAGPAGVDQVLVIVTEHPRRLSALASQAATATAPFSNTGADARGRRALVDFIVGAGVGAVSPRFGAHWIQIEELP